MTELLTMSMKDLDRLKVIQTVLAGTLTWHEAAEQLTLSERQIGNVVARHNRVIGLHRSVVKERVECPQCKEPLTVSRDECGSICITKAFLLDDIHDQYEKSTGIASD